MKQPNVGRRWISGLAVSCVLLGGSTLATSQVRFGVGVALPGLSIGINIPTYPSLAPIPGYPVYYAPGLSANLFFYDGLYWVFAGDSWYYSSWYDGPWYLAQPELVPDFILRIPILYYRSPPPYFLHWNRQAAPRWGEHWGRSWEEHRRGWDRWNRAAVPPRAPLPSYQRQYPQGRYPGADRQGALENRYYPYRPREPADRSRLREAPQAGQRFAPQPGQPQRLRAPPPPPANAGRAERRMPEANRSGARPAARPAPSGNRGAPQGRAERRGQSPSRDEGGRDRRGGDRPPG